ncbi:MAG: class I SAM-dependent methyltransferase [Thermaurantiacus sp.]
MTHIAEERVRLEAIARDSWYTEPMALATIRYSFRMFRRYIELGMRVLEMGPAEGTMTDLLVASGFEPDILEGSSEFADILRQRHPTLHVHNSLFEEFEPDTRYDAIILGHVLEHVADPVAILARVRRWLVPETGAVLAAVPNARSLHRQAAVIMGLLPFEEAMSEKDVHHGHRRVYNPETFRRDFLAAGLRIDVFGGYWIKPLSDRQLEADWTPEAIEAFMALGERYPDIAAELVIVASAGAQ